MTRKPTTTGAARAHRILNSVTVLVQEADSAPGLRRSTLRGLHDVQGPPGPGGGRMRREARWLFGVLVLGALAASGGAVSGGSGSRERRARPSSGEDPSYVLIPLGSLGGTLQLREQHQRSGCRRRALGAARRRDGPRDALARARPHRPGNARAARTAPCSGRRRTASIWWPGSRRPTRTSRWPRPGAAASSSPPAPGRPAWAWSGTTGSIRALPTLGGENGFATSANNHRQIVGWAETQVLDPTCTGRQKRQFLAVLWGPGERRAARSCRRCRATRPAPPPASTTTDRRWESPGRAASPWAG